MAEFLGCRIQTLSSVNTLSLPQPPIPRYKKEELALTVFCGRAPPIDRVPAFCRRHDHLNPAEILGAAPRFAQLRHRPTQMALDRRRPDLEGTAGYQPRVLKSSINVDNLRWKMIGVCLHQPPPPRPKPARLAHLACHAPNDLGTAPLPLTSASSNSAAAIARSRAARSSLAVPNVSSIPARAPGSRAVLMKSSVMTSPSGAWRAWSYATTACESGNHSSPRFAMPSARAISIMDVHMSGPPTSSDACRRRRTPCSSHPLPARVGRVAGANRRWRGGHRNRSRTCRPCRCD